MEKIWNKGLFWETNEYNKRLSEENKIFDEIDGKRHILDEEEKQRVINVWKK